MRSLFWRLFLIFLMVVMVSMAVLSAAMLTINANSRINEQENALIEHTREIAAIASRRINLRLGVLIINSEADALLEWKIRRMWNEYGAQVVIIDKQRLKLSIAGDDSALDPADVYEYFNRVVSGEQIVVRRIVNSQPVFTIGMPIFTDEALVGAVFLQTNEREVQPNIADIALQVGWAAAVSLLLGVLILIPATIRLTRPLKSMAAASRDIAHGNFETRITHHGHDEIAQLAEAFNAMSIELSQMEETRKDFVANVSHELRSPMTAIQGFISGMLDHTIPNEEWENYLHIVSDEVRRLTKLVSELLDLSRIESGKFELHVSTFDINETIRRVLIQFEQKIDEKHLEIEPVFRQDVCKVAADPDRIEQVLYNIIDNAVKFSNDGGRLSVWTYIAGNTAVISVNDEGVGIEEADRSLIFDRFFTADRAHTSGKGTGLGLSIVKKILQQHGQEITVQSTPGKGTTVTFTLNMA